MSQSIQHQLQAAAYLLLGSLFTTPPEIRCVSEVRRFIQKCCYRDELRFQGNLSDCLWHSVRVTDGMVRVKIRRALLICYRRARLYRLRRKVILKHLHVLVEEVRVFVALDLRGEARVYVYQLVDIRTSFTMRFMCFS